MADARKLRQSIEEQITFNSVATIFQQYIAMLQDFFPCYSYGIIFSLKGVLLVPWEKKILLIPKGIKVALYSLITRSKVRLKIVGGGKINCKIMK
jgi:hypothetical protein